MYVFLDIFFTVFHLLIILFNILGWIWVKTRKANLILLILTGLSWFVLGIFYGIGYCPITDWHWKVLRKLGYTNLPNDYVVFLIKRFFGLSINNSISKILIVAFYTLGLVISIFLNIKDFKKSRTKQRLR